MKKKVLLPALLIVVIAALAFAEVWVVSHNDPNPDFGLVREVYSFAHPETPITDCEGDTDILNVEAVIWDEMQLMYPLASLRLTAAKDVAFTTGIYSGGATEKDPKYFPKSSIERLEDGEWAEYGELWASHTSLLMHGEPPFSGMSAGTMEWEFGIPVNDPGTYRITVYFRELLSREYYRYATGDELYHVTFTITIPEASKKPFDVISMRIDGYGYWDRVSAAHIAIRMNGEKNICMDLAMGTLEMFKDGEWVDVTHHLQKLTEEDIAQGAYRYIGDLWRNGNVYHCSAHFNAIDIEYEHRLKLEFCENDDGTGERYTLTLRLRFDE